MEIKEKRTSIIRWGIIGCGDVTEVKSGPAFNKTKGFRLDAVMRRNLDKVKDYAKRHGVEKYFTNADDLINDAEIDAVYIATPPDSHKLYALKVAEAGKPCCIEKPMAPNYADALAIYQAFHEKDLPLFVAYYRRSLPRFEQVKTWLRNEEIGQVRHINWQLCQAPGELDLSGVYNWRTDPEIAPGGYFDDLACHGLDLFAYFLGEIKDASGFSLNQQGLYEAEDAVSASWIHKNGVTGAGNWNFGSSIQKEQVEIFGSEGKIEFSVFEDAPLLLRNKGGQKEFYIKHPENIQLQHVENMRDHLFGKSKHPSMGASGIHANWVMDKILVK